MTHGIVLTSKSPGKSLFLKGLFVFSLVSVRNAYASSSWLVWDGDGEDGASPFMKLLELLNAANHGYPDGYLAEYYDAKTGSRKRGSGDTLAEFIVLELIDTFDSKADDDSQIGIAAQLLERARTDLLGVIQALRNWPGTSRVVR